MTEATMGGAGDGGAAGGAAGGGAGDGGAAGGGTGDGGGAPGAGGGAADPTIASLLAELGAVKSTLASLEGAKADADSAAEAARVAALTDAEAAAEARTKLLGEIETEKSALAAERQLLVDGRREAALDRMGFDKRLHALAPAGDPSTSEGAAALDEWGLANKDLARQAAGDAPAWTPGPKSNLSRILGGEIKNPLISQDSVSKMLGGS